MIPKNDFKLIKDIIDKYLDPSLHKAFIFGSRAKGNAREFSDYDIGIEGPKLSAALLFDLIGEFEDSPLPYKVDLVEMKNVSHEFYKLATETIQAINY